MKNGKMDLKVRKVQFWTSKAHTTFDVPATLKYATVMAPKDSFLLCAKTGKNRSTRSLAHII